MLFNSRAHITCLCYTCILVTERQVVIFSQLNRDLRLA